MLKPYETRPDGRHYPSYRDLFPEPPPAGLVPSCAEAGVLGALTGVIGTLQALEVIKLITGIGEPLVGRLLLYDALGGPLRHHPLRGQGVTASRPRSRCCRLPTEFDRWEAICLRSSELPSPIWTASSTRPLRRIA